MKKKDLEKLNRVQCPNCKYCNDKDFLKYTGICHGCGKILDEKAYFKAQMNKKLRLWKGEKMKKW